MSFDQEPDGDIHGECAFEIRQLQKTIEKCNADLKEVHVAYDELKIQKERWYNEHQKVLDVKNDLIKDLQHAKDCVGASFQREHELKEELEQLWKALSDLYFHGSEPKALTIAKHLREKRHSGAKNGQRKS